MKKFFILSLAFSLVFPSLSFAAELTSEEKTSQLASIIESIKNLINSLKNDQTAAVVGAGNTFTEKVNAELDSLISGTGARDFSIYQSTDPSLKGVFKINTNSWTSKLDFTGVTTWQNEWGDARKAGTLIAPQFLLQAEHYVLPLTVKERFVNASGVTEERTVSTKVRFVDKSGNVEERTLVDYRFVSGGDQRVVKLDRPLPTDRFKVYKVLDFNDAYSSISVDPLVSYDRPEVSNTNNKNYYINNNLKLIALNQDRNVLIHLTNQDFASSVHPPSRLSLLIQFIMANRFYNIEEKYINPKFSEVRQGDSGSPLFIVFNNELILMSIFSYTHVGNFLPYSIDKINAAIASMGGTDKVGVVRISGFVKENQPPRFSIDSKDKNLQVVEKSPIGTVIGKVSAEDPDSAIGQTLTYSIIGGSGKDLFTINGSNGEISVRDSIGLDYSVVQKVKLFVKAEDNGNPKKADYLYDNNITKYFSAVDVEVKPRSTTQTPPATLPSTGGAVKPTYTINISKAGLASGMASVTTTMPGISCGTSCSNVNVTLSEGSTITLTAVPGTSFFGGWSGGGCSGTNLTCTVVVGPNLVSNNNITATFNSSATVVNRPPVADAGSDQTITLPSPALLSASASSDPDRNNLIFSWSKVSGPGNVSFSASTNKITSASFSTAGTYELKVSVSDSKLISVDSVNIVVLAPVITPTPNSAPVLQTIGNKTIAENSTLTITLVATDADNNTLSYTATNLPQGGTLSGNTFTWHPSYTQSGSYTPTFKVSDGKGGTDTETITIGVTNTNRAPVASAGSDQIINILSSSLSGNASSDPDGNSLNFSWTKVSGIGTVTFSNPSSAVTNATFSAYGPYVLRLTVSDGALSSYDDVSIGIAQVNSGIRKTDTDGDGKNDEIDYCPGTPVLLKTESNTFGCLKPKISNFDIRPNLERNLNNVKGLELGKSGVGKITFNSDVSFTRNTELLDVDSNLTISSKKVSLDSSDIPELNKPATITLYNLTEKEPKILRDGVECKSPQCVINSYSNGTLVFTVTGFSTYEVTEGAVDNSSSDDEDSNDNSSGSSGGGGGGGVSSRSKTTNTTTSNITLPSNATREQLIAYLVAKIQELIAEYNRVKALEDAQNGITTSDNPLKGFQFTKTFGVGTTDKEVRYLQRFLNTHGFPVGTGLGSYGKEVDTFGPVTKATLIKYQLANGIEGTGYFGNLTKAKVNQTLLTE